MGDAALLLWLRARHARTALGGVLRLFGTGMEKGERIYLLYLAAVMGVWATLMGAWLVASAADAFALLGAQTVCSAARGALASCGLAFFAAGAQGLRTPPLRLSHADVAYVAASPMGAQPLALVEAGCAALGWAALGGAAAFSLAHAAAACAALGAIAGAACAAAGRLVGAVRLSRARWGARHVVAALVALAAVACAQVAISLCARPLAFGAFSAVVVAAAFAMLALVARRMDMAAVVKEGALRADLRLVGAFSPLDERAKADYRRRCVLAARPLRFGLPPGEGRAALVARAALSHARQREGLPALAFHGTVVVPLGALAVAGAGDPVLFLFWLQAAVLMPQGARELSRAFFDDVRNRLVRDRLPFGTLELLAFDSLPAFALTTALACASCVLVLPPGASAFEVCALAVAVNACLLAACALDAVRPRAGGLWARWMCFELGVAAMVATAFFLSLVAPSPVAGAGIVVVTAACARAVRSGIERAG
ncbi:hypothetical protein B5F40_05510 [Gordonibacter sp. An230]|uniref:hypothetical protein n=1 Tax=Gordonibacter sp. An230 TaxID=1965592 RepID=UPI000B36FED1|nr:hypothetical protein [Gordonibacter sp. An230]OUO90917.1 hypothetical protein B5F40_05510 [Gordonibacter sp. An230]